MRHAGDRQTSNMRACGIEGQMRLIMRMAKVRANNANRRNARSRRPSLDSPVLLEAHCSNFEVGGLNLTDLNLVGFLSFEFAVTVLTALCFELSALIAFFSTSTESSRVLLRDSIDLRFALFDGGMQGSSSFVASSASSVELIVGRGLLLYSPSIFQ